MPASNLQELAEQFCEVIAVETPDLLPDTDGVLSFSVNVREVDLIVRNDPHSDPDHALVYLVFGHVPEDREVPVLRELLHANLAMSGPQAPAFSRNPLTGHVLLQYAWPMANVSGRSLWHAIQDVIDAILKWRSDFGLEVAALRPAHAAPRDHLA